MSDMQAQFATLSPEQRKLLELLAHKQAAQAASDSAAETPTAESGTIDQAYPRERLEASAQRPDLSPALGSYHA
jgi:hypothetical protein